MKLCWGFSYDKNVVVQCIQKYFPRGMEVISEPPHPYPEAQKYSYPRDKAFSEPKLAWEHLKAKRLYDLEYARRSLDEINSDLTECEKFLNPTVDQNKNVVALKRGDE
jgi:hypothetical protein